MRRQIRPETILLPTLLLLAIGAAVALASEPATPTATLPATWGEVVTLAGGGLEWLLGLVISLLVADQGWRAILRRGARIVVLWVEGQARQGELAARGTAKLARARLELRERYPWATRLVTERKIIDYLESAVKKHAPPRNSKD